ncbi:magnesium/cobalt efflux protein [Alkalilimnicola ehrlichii]|uniref:Magnesium/cobalt efflux protein n=1 Tax=Alkalilimnicola ehrlichii TaxID=351052 RepID=A0A3E0X077_9GAMM|nr:HlyC/CorC family transporter [Alkalilimnicola ehrlichii]RFA30871.1 magnesium/cobalt efflux protein [Alkalilimnicola ehrlichii]RFA38822.1 magnesium/cobalt efflux protein [Alkalilimnicola ehrlichii]
MSDIPTGVLFGILIGLIILSACFSGSETGMMALNRYRLRHLARSGHRGARMASSLLKKPDRLIGIILLGNNFVNIIASALATVIALRLGGEGAIAIATGILTLVVLIFAEVTPKTVAALYPERVAFPASFVLSVLLRIFYPLVWIVNGIANNLLRLLGVPIGRGTNEHLSQEELRTVVNEAGAMIPRRHQRMLLNILDLEKATVEDIMVPRNEIVGIDLEDDWETILEELKTSQYTRLPVYRGSIDDVQGVLHLRKVLSDALNGSFTRDDLLQRMREPYFIPEGTQLHTQLLNFQRNRRRNGLVVDEYGEILGLATLEDILEEIVGEFTTDPSANIKDVHRQKDGSYLAEGSASVRELNRLLDWDLPTNGPKTLNGVILEHLEYIPEPGTSLLVNGYPVTIVQTKDNRVKMAQIQPHRPRRARTKH